MKNRILIVDDNVSLTTLLGKTLGKFDYDVEVENDSEFALDTTRKVNPDLILLDVMMPHRNGGEVLAELRNDLALRNIPVILLTGLAREAQSIANTGGIQSLIFSKPVELKPLILAIDEQIAAARTYREQVSDRMEQMTGAPVEEVQSHAFGAGGRTPGPAPSAPAPMPSVPDRGGAFGGPVAPAAAAGESRAGRAFGGMPPMAVPNQSRAGRGFGGGGGPQAAAAASEGPSSFGFTPRPEKPQAAVGEEAASVLPR